MIHTYDKCPYRDKEEEIWDRGRVEKYRAGTPCAETPLLVTCCDFTECQHQDMRGCFCVDCCANKTCPLGVVI